jgi:hypothetical protein
MKYYKNLIFFIKLSSTAIYPTKQTLFPIFRLFKETGEWVMQLDSYQV